MSKKHISIFDTKNCVTVFDSEKNILFFDGPFIYHSPDLGLLLGRSSSWMFLHIYFYIEKKKGVIKNHQGKPWIPMSSQSLAASIGISVSTIKRGIKILKNSGLIDTASLSDHKSDRTLWYTINYERLKELLKEKPEKARKINKLNAKQLSVLKPLSCQTE